MRPWLFAATIAACVALAMGVAELQSPDQLMWTGRSISAVDRSGIVEYTYNGIDFHQPLQGASDAPGPTAVTVEVDPSNPYNVILDRAAPRIFDALVVGVPAAGAMALVIVGLLRQRAIRRGNRAAAAGAGFGIGFDSEVLQRLGDDTRRPH